MPLYVLRRFLAILPILGGVSIICFSFVHLAPGDPAIAVMPENATPAVLAQIRAMYGFDQPLPVQYLKWLHAVLSGNFGDSIMTGRPVLAEVIPAALHTAQLAIAAIVISLLLGCGMGLLAGHTRRVTADRAITTVSVLGISVPHYWMGMVLVAIFAVKLRLLPAMGMGSAAAIGGFALGDIRYVVLPAVTLSLIPTGIIARTVRASVIEVQKQDFVDTLRSSGLARRRIFLHVAKNAAPAILAIIGLQIAQLLGGSILVETVFAWPGTGYLLNNAIATRDLPLLQGTTLLLAVFFVMMNLIVDLVQPFLDPRIARQ
jgi:peptide/nickel transport system permease protein